MISRPLGICIILLIFVFATTSCNKNNEPHTTIDADLKAAFNYQVGTYWIYKDSLTGDEDSLYVTGNSFISTSSGSSFLDAITINIKELPLKGHMPRDSSQWSYILDKNALNLTWVVNFGQLTTYPFTIGFTNIDDALDSANVYDILPSYIIKMATNFQM